MARKATLMLCTPVPARRFMLLAGMLAFAMSNAAAGNASNWHVPEAPLRFNVRIRSQPTDQRAGMAVTLPDGGFLPRPYPVSTVIDRAGNKLDSECVWFNPDEGFAIVFERPTVGMAVWVYVHGADQLTMLTPQSRFRPSLMVYIQPVPPGSADLQGAERLAAHSPPGSNARFGFVDEIRARDNPLWHNGHHFVTYYNGWIRPQRAGTTWIATVSQDASLVKVDGNTVAAWPAGMPREDGDRGEIGGNVELSDDIHHLEYHHFQSTGPLEMLLAWRPSGRSSGLPDEMDKESYIHSGKGELIGAESRDGAPLPLISAEHLNHLWLFDTPLFLVRYSTRLVRDNPDDTAYTWQIGDSPPIRDNDFLWIIEGTRERTVRLDVASEKGNARATLPFYLESNTQSASVNNPDHRRAYRQAYLNMCRMLPQGVSPARRWSETMWQTLLEVLEPYRGSALLTELFDRSYEDIREMPVDIRQRLQDYFFEVIRYTNKDAAAAWLRKFYEDAEDRNRRLRWQLTKVDFLIYDVGDTNSAQRIIRNLQRASGDPEISIRADIREADVKRLAGDHERAARLYSRAQDRSSALRRSRQTQRSLEAHGGARGAEAIREARERRRTEPLRHGVAQTRIEDWRIMAVRGSMHYETVKELIRTGYLFEARDALAEWEFEFPMHKVAEDFLVAEAEYYMTIGNYRRAELLLSNYRDGVGMTNFLPIAMRMELDCLLKLEKDDKIQELVREIQRRLPNHPIAEKAANVLNTL